MAGQSCRALGDEDEPACGELVSRACRRRPCPSKTMRPRPRGEEAGDALSVVDLPGAVRADERDDLALLDARTRRSATACTSP